MAAHKKGKTAQGDIYSFAQHPYQLIAVLAVLIIALAVTVEMIDSSLIQEARIRLLTGYQQYLGR